ncbi:uncharacterized protein TNCV_3407941 [Trichonephila clavipes]|nr:uncharacterized protein TNCV_3407941 [Trichonephila clavipes]
MICGRIRVHYEQLSEFQRGRIIGLKEAGWANRRITRHMGRTDAAIGRCLQEWVDSGRFQHHDVFGDESRFQPCPDDHRRRVWRRPGQHADPAFTPHRPSTSPLPLFFSKIMPDHIWHACSYELSYSLSNTSLALQIAKFLSNRACLGYDGKATTSTRECYCPGSTIGEAKTRHRVSLVSAHVTTLEEDLKQQPLCQDNPKNIDVLSDSGLEMELAIPFVPNRDPPDTPINNPSSVRSCIIIHQNEVVTNSSSIWADIWIKDLIPISKTSYGSSMEHMQVSVATERDPCLNQDSTTSITVSFNSVGLMVSSALFPRGLKHPDQ